MTYTTEYENTQEEIIKDAQMHKTPLHDATRTVH